MILMRHKWPDLDVDEGNVGDHCVRCVQPNKFFAKSTTSTTAQPVESTEPMEHMDCTTVD